MKVSTEFTMEEFLNMSAESKAERECPISNETFVGSPENKTLYDWIGNIIKSQSSIKAPRYKYYNS